MQLKQDGDRLDRLQSILIGGIIDSIKEHVDSVELPTDKARELVESISFSVAAILDASRSVEYEGVEATPIITFQEENDELVYPGGNSWMHEYVFGIISDIYGE